MHLFNYLVNHCSHQITPPNNIWFMTCVIFYEILKNNKYKGNICARNFVFIFIFIVFVFVLEVVIIFSIHVDMFIFFVLRIILHFNFIRNIVVYIPNNFCFCLFIFFLQFFSNLYSFVFLLNHLYIFALQC